MWCWTFYFVKCDAEHFTKENVMQKCIFAQRCWTFSFGKCDAEHFPLENVQQNKMYASNTFLHQKIFCIKFIFARSLSFSKKKLREQNLANFYFQWIFDQIEKKRLCLCFTKFFFGKTRDSYPLLAKMLWTKNAFFVLASFFFANRFLIFCLQNGSF